MTVLRSLLLGTGLACLSPLLAAGEPPVAEGRDLQFPFPVPDLAVAPDGSALLLVRGGKEPALVRWSLANESVDAVVEGSDGATDVAMAGDHIVLACSSPESEVRILDPRGATPPVVREVDAIGIPVGCVRLYPHVSLDRMLVSLEDDERSSADRCVGELDLATGEVSVLVWTDGRTRCAVSPAYLHERWGGGAWRLSVLRQDTPMHPAARAESARSRAQTALRAPEAVASQGHCRFVLHTVPGGNGIIVEWLADPPQVSLVSANLLHQIWSSPGSVLAVHEAGTHVLVGDLPGEPETPTRQFDVRALEVATGKVVFERTVHLPGDWSLMFETPGNALDTIRIWGARRGGSMLLLSTRWKGYALRGRWVAVDLPEP
jgi:hypothetical protein